MSGGRGNFSMLSLPAFHEVVLYFYFQEVSRIPLPLHLSPATRSEPLSSHMGVSASFLIRLKNLLPSHIASSLWSKSGAFRMQSQTLFALRSKPCNGFHLADSKSLCPCTGPKGPGPHFSPLISLWPLFAHSTPATLASLLFHRPHTLSRRTFATALGRTVFTQKSALQLLLRCHFLKEAFRDQTRLKLPSPLISILLTLFKVSVFKSHFNILWFKITCILYFLSLESKPLKDRDLVQAG